MFKYNLNLDNLQKEKSVELNSQTLKNDQSQKENKLLKDEMTELQKDIQSLTLQLSQSQKEKKLLKDQLAESKKELLKLEDENKNLFNYVVAKN